MKYFLSRKAFFVVFYISFYGIFLSCGNPSEYIENTSNNNTYFPHLAALETLCRNTGGQWHAQLMSCSCSPYSVFFLGDGCRAVDLNLVTQSSCIHHLKEMPPQELQACLSRALSALSSGLEIDLENLNNSHIDAISDTASHDLTRLIQGITLPKNALTSTHMKLTHPTGLQAQIAWEPWIDGAYNSFMFSVIDPTVIKNAFHRKTFYQQCIQALQNYGYVSNRSTHCSLCNDAANIIEDIIQPTSSITSDQYDVNFTQEGEDCYPECAWVLNARNTSVPALYNVMMSKFLPMVRYIVVSAANAIDLFVFLSPLGQVQSIVLSESMLTPPYTSYLISNQIFIWNHDWTLETSMTYPEGDRTGTFTALTHLTPSKGLLPTDAGRSWIDTPINALIIDSGIDIRVPYLRARLKLNASAATQALQHGNIIDSLFSYPRSLVGHTSDLLSSHGSEIISILTAGLPYASIDLIRADHRIWQAEKLDIPKRWIEKIHQSQPRVVNISQAYGRDVANCDRFIGKVFKALPHVLFVVGMGNSGGHNPSATCPAGIAYKYPHVITVAGTDESGKRIDPYSNYGSEVAMVAAPMNAPALDVEKSVQAGYPKLKVTGGTSISAAWVSNAALRILTQHSAMHPHEVIDLLMQACKKDGLDVACGGEIDFKKIEANLTHG